MPLEQGGLDISDLDVDGCQDKLGAMPKGDDASAWVVTSAPLARALQTPRMNAKVWALFEHLVRTCACLSAKEKKISTFEVLFTVNDECFYRTIFSRCDTSFLFVFMRLFFAGCCRAWGQRKRTYKLSRRRCSLVATCHKAYLAFQQRAKPRGTDKSRGVSRGAAGLDDDEDFWDMFGEEGRVETDKSGGKNAHRDEEDDEEQRAGGENADEEGGVSGHGKRSDDEEGGASGHGKRSDDEEGGEQHSHRFGEGDDGEREQDEEEEAQRQESFESARGRGPPQEAVTIASGKRAPRAEAEAESVITLGAEAEAAACDQAEIVITPEEEEEDVETGFGA